MQPKISLCLIVGNVSEYIDRCLESFLPIADELCVVRAIGSLTPDDTLHKIEIAVNRYWLYKGRLLPPDGFLKTSDYKNASGHEDWPHVDNFAAARQMSFDLATGEYCFWCDSDDVLESGADLIREHAARGGYPCFMFPYRIFGRGIALPRERMMLRGSGRWQWPVHENFKFKVEPAEAIRDDRVVVKHLPHLNKNDSIGRNLRILESMPVESLSTGLLYHLHVELVLAARIPESIEVAKRLLQKPDLGKPEKYDVFMNFAQCAPSPEQKKSFLIQAYGTDPRRREALYLLTANAMNDNDPEAALAHARQMIATPRPEESWNDRAAIYGWAGQDMYAQALRANRMWSEADKVRQESMAAHSYPRIALIHATRGRPEQAAYTRKLWMDFAEQPERVEHIFVFDDDDKESIPLARMHHLRIKAGGGCVAAWNHGAFATTAPILIQLSDDWIPVSGWDQLIVDRIGDVNEPKVLAVSDGVRSDDLLCMAIMTRKYLAIDQFMFHPFFTGVYSDNWFTEQAYARNAVIQARDIVFTHDHPIHTGRELDATYQAQNAPERYHEGKQVLDYLHKGNDWSTVPGFFNYWPFYQRVASALKDGDTVCEVGVWLGRSIIYLAQTLQRLGKNVKLIAVDHFKGESNQLEHEATVKLCGGKLLDAFTENIRRCGVEDMIQIIDADSVEAARQVKDGSLAFCWIDAAHDYESVKRDIRAWEPKVRPDGLFAGHDAQHEPVLRAVQELIPNHQVIACLWLKR